MTEPSPVPARNPRRSRVPPSGRERRHRNFNPLRRCRRPLTGVLQVLAGLLKLGALIRFVSRSVVTGFVNALAILIFLAQVPELTGGTWHVYPMVAAGLAIIYLLPRMTKAVPSALVCIIGLTVVAMLTKMG